jgi:hypothetical protein
MDNVQVDPPIRAGGAVIAADDIGGILYQRVKIAVGEDGVLPVDVSDKNPLPVSLEKLLQPLRIHLETATALLNVNIVGSSAPLRVIAQATAPLPIQIQNTTPLNVNIPTTAPIPVTLGNVRNTNFLAFFVADPSPSGADATNLTGNYTTRKEIEMDAPKEMFIHSFTISAQDNSNIPLSGYVSSGVVYHISLGYVEAGSVTPQDVAPDVSKLADFYMTASSIDYEATAGYTVFTARYTFKTPIYLPPPRGGGNSKIIVRLEGDFSSLASHKVYVVGEDLS